MTKPSSKTDERRKEFRKDDEIKVIIETIPTAEGEAARAIHALTQDISLCGARIRSDTHFSPGTRLRILLTLSRIRQVVRLDAEVRWVKTLFDGDLHDIGLEFDHKIHSDIMTLIRHIYGMEAGIVPPPTEE